MSSNTTKNNVNNLPVICVKYKEAYWISQEYILVSGEEKTYAQIIFQLEDGEELNERAVPCEELKLGTQLFLGDLPFRVVSIKDYTNLQSGAWILDVFAYPPTSDEESIRHKKLHDKMLALVPALEKVLAEESK